MNKKVIAMAVTAAMVAPLAQAEVELSGRAYAEWSTGTGMTGAVIPGVNDAGDYGQISDSRGHGRFRMKASDDLGNGMTMYSKAEFQIDVTDGGQTKSATTVGARDGYVGLKGDFGTFAMGRFNGAYKTTNVDPFIATQLEARGNGGASSGSLAHNGFNSSMMQYTTKVGGGALNFQTNALNSDVNNGVATQHLLSYKMGAIIFGYATTDAAATGNSNMKLAYKAKNFTVSYESVGANTDTSVGEDATYIYANYRMGDYTVAFGTRSGTTAASDATYVMLGGKKNFSKSSSMYYGYRSSDVGTNATLGNGTTALVVGLRQDF
ncbi:MAG: porin [Gammaproteobacteria bacterium]|nr:porin [Gammaproteobacteria bacterium]